jgi:hypothetical protein
METDHSGCAANVERCPITRASAHAMPDHRFDFARPSGGLFALDCLRLRSGRREKGLGPLLSLSRPTVSPSTLSANSPERLGVSPLRGQGPPLP